MMDPVKLANFKASEARQLADAASARGNEVAAARLYKSASGWRQAALHAQARKDNPMTRQHPEIEAMRNKFYDDDPDREDDSREAIRVALNWVLNPKLPDSDIIEYLPKLSQPAGYIGKNAGHVLGRPRAPDGASGHRK